MAHAGFQPQEPKKNTPIPDFDELFDYEAPQTEASPQLAPRTREPKTSAPMPVKRPAAKGTDDKSKKLVGIYFYPQEHIELKSAALQTGKSVTEIVEEAAIDAIRYTYVCTEPACHHKFTLRRDVTGEPEPASYCPVCGSQNVIRDNL